MKKSKLSSLLLVSLVWANFSCETSESSNSQKEQYNEVLYSSSIDENNGSEALVREAYFPPGWKAPRHYHNGHLFLYIIEGEFELIMGEAGKAVYKAGDALEMKPGVEMDARNPSDVNPLKIAVFQVGKPDAPFVVPVE
ncbi:MAG: cupin domain-containing protein [Cyclobacteriaceae bacterium]